LPSALPELVQLICEKGIVSPAVSASATGTLAVTEIVPLPLPGVR